MLDAVEPEPPQQPGRVEAHRPGAGAVVGEVRGCRTVIADQMVGDVVSIQVGHRVVEQTVTVEIQTSGIEYTVAVQVDIGCRTPHGRRAIAVTEAVLHDDQTVRSPLAFHHFCNSSTASSCDSGPRSKRSSLRYRLASPTCGPAGMSSSRMISLPSRSGRTR